MVGTVEHEEFGNERRAPLALAGLSERDRPLGSVLHDCRHVEGSAFSVDCRKVPLTIGVGLSEGHSEDTLETILRRADAARYAAKGAGRNRIQISACAVRPGYIEGGLQ